MQFSDKIMSLASKAENDVRECFQRIDAISLQNTAKILDAFAENRVSANMFAGTTGYGYDDLGRETLEKVFAAVFKAEAALVRPNFVNGTHAITAALFSAVRPGDILLSATGMPYDTLQTAIGISGDYPGTLKYYGVGFEMAELGKDGRPDMEAILSAASDPRVAAVTIQRSRGYASRPTLSAEKIGEIADLVHSVNPRAAVIVDNCYGEFTELCEPVELGADLCAGSLIKNPGGGLAPTGGYVVGRKDLVDAAAMRLTVPGIGGECGSYEPGYRLFFQGLLNAPHAAAQALKTAVFCARMLELIGFKPSPASNETRYDIIQSVDLGNAELLQKFCKGIQLGSPIDSYVTPIPWDMPGYEDQVIMAAGAFVQGASIELSCDGPMRPPYTAFLQGGLTYESGKLGIMKAISELFEESN